MEILTTTNFNTKSIFRYDIQSILVQFNSEIMAWKSVVEIMDTIRINITNSKLNTVI